MFRRGCGIFYWMYWKYDFLKLKVLIEGSFFFGRIESVIKWFGYLGNCFGYGRVNCNINCNSSSWDCGGCGLLVIG